MMNKRNILSIVVLVVALLVITTMTGCGGEPEPTEPKIKTTIDPKNWARVEDYAVYETEAVETEPEETEPVVTEPVIEETEPPVEETEPVALVYYNVAKDATRAFITADLGEFFIGDESFNILTLTTAELESKEFVKGDAVKNSGVGSQYFFDGYQYSKDNSILYIDADENGLIRAIKIVDPGVAILNNTVSINMELNSFYDAIEAVLADGDNLGRMMPAEGVKSYSYMVSAGYRAVFTCTSDGLKEIAIFAEDYVSTWGPITN